MFQKSFVLVLGTFFSFTRLSSIIVTAEIMAPLEERCSLETGCVCADFDQTVSITCSNMTDFGKLQSLIEIYGPNSQKLFEITFKELRIIPSNFIRNLTLSTLTLDDCSIKIISNDALNGVKAVTAFKIRISSIIVLPNFGPIANTLEYLNFDNSKLMAIGDKLQNLRGLIELTLRNNSIQTVQEDAFYGLRKLRTLDLSHNLLTSLPPRLLNDLPSLQLLILSFNQLISVRGLFAMARLKIIFLDHNNLTDSKDILSNDMVELETLQLSYNPLTNITEDTFYRRVPNMRFLSLNNCFLIEFHFSCLKNLSKLIKIDLSSNLIENVSEEIIDFGSNLEIILNDNRITSFDAELTYNVQSLYLSGNRMRHLGTTLWLTQVAEAELNRNQLSAILEEDLKGMHGTSILSFSQNNISRIDSPAFVSVRNDLQKLDLSQNQLRYLNGSLRYLSTLTHLNISYNYIRTIQKDEFVGLNELKELFMHHNKIIALQGQLQTIPHLRYLAVQHNNLNAVDARQLPKSLQIFYYKNNPIICDCFFLSFLTWLEKEDSPKIDMHYCQNINASQTNNSSVIPSVYVSNTENCPELCKCHCSHDTNDTFISIDCSSVGIVDAPEQFRKENHEVSIQLFHISKISTVVRQNADSRFTVSDRVLAVNLENNSIQSLDNWTFPRQLKVLRLANNGLTTLPLAVKSLPLLRSTSLSGNPWFCDCEAITFKKWLISKRSVVKDLNNTKCSPANPDNGLEGKVIAYLSDGVLCPVAIISLYATTAFGILLLLLVFAGLKIAYTQYELHIKVWLYAHGVSWVKEEELDEDKLFDAFMSFSYKDEPFVISELVSEIESRLPDIRLCLHYRHFLAGEYIQNNILNAVRSSKRTVLVLTKEFFESEWCLMEFRAAHQQSLEDKVNRIMVLKVGKMPEEIDPTVKTYLESTTYVTWDEKYFWEKFLYALPTPTSKSRSYSAISTATFVETISV